MAYLPEMDLIKLTQSETNPTEAQFIIEPLLPGFGVTLGNTLRRVLLSSLRGAAISAVKINDVTHEFTTVAGVTEDSVAIILNLKGVRIKYEGDEPVTITLDVKGPKVVTAGDFKTPSGVEIINTDHVIAHVNEKVSLSIEARVESGKGYIPTEQRKGESLPVGMIAIDAVFSPIKKIHHEITNTRVGQKTDFDRLSIDVTTDGSLTAVDAFKTALTIVHEYFSMINDQVSTTSAGTKPKATRAKKKKSEETLEEGTQE